MTTTATTKPKTTKAKAKKAEPAAPKALKLGKIAPMPRAPTIADLRAAVATAEAEGVPTKNLTLHLTFRDESLLKRSPLVQVSEIAFKDGEMRFLGVKVVAAPEGVSFLEKPE